MSYGFSNGGVTPVKGGASAVLAEAKTRKRAKHVFDTGEIPHLWAHKVQESARNPQGNLYFDGDVIYSYGSHFPIARHILDNPTRKNPKPAVLLTTRTYSVTTSGHVFAVRRSIPSNIPVFHVTHPTDSPASALADYVKRAEYEIASAVGRKMETTKNADVQNAAKIIEECKAFCKFFSLKTPKLPTLPKIDRKKLAQQTKAIRDRQVAREAQRKAAWEARKAREKATADAWNASGVCTHTPRHDAHKYGQVYECEQQRDREEWETKKDEIIARWRAGDTTAQLCNAWELDVMLRLVSGPDGPEVETSKGARVPAAHALAALAFVRKIVVRGEEFVSNGHTFHLGHYKIDKVTADGTLYAGCHVISFAEIERFAPQLEALAV